MRALQQQCTLCLRCSLKVYHIVQICFLASAAFSNQFTPACSRIVCISGPQPFWHKGLVSWKTPAHFCCAARSNRLWPWGWGYQSIWSSDLSVRFKSVHCSKFRNEEENIQLFWSCPTTSSYPLLLPFSSGFCAFQNQGRNVDSIATSKQDTSFHLAHELQCLPWLHYLVRSLPHLTFFVDSNTCFHNHRL